MEGDNNDNEKGKGKANNNMGDFFGFLTNFLAPESRFTIFIIPVKANPSKLFDDNEEEEDKEEGSRGGTTRTRPRRRRWTRPTTALIFGISW